MTDEEQEEIQRVRRECDEHAAEEVRWMMGTCCEDYWRAKLGLADEGDTL